MSKPADATVQVLITLLIIAIESAWFYLTDAKPIARSTAKDYDSPYSTRPANRKNDLFWVFSFALRWSILP